MLFHAQEKGQNSNLLLQLRTFSLFLIRMKVGMAEMLYSWAASSFSSTSILTNTTLSISEAHSSILGAIILQGPHQVAKKSITTSLSPASSRAVFKSARVASWFTMLPETMLACHKTALLERLIIHGKRLSSIEWRRANTFPWYRVEWKVMC